MKKEKKIEKLKKDKIVKKLCRSHYKTAYIFGMCLGIAVAATITIHTALAIFCFIGALFMMKPMQEIHYRELGQQE